MALKRCRPKCLKITFLEFLPLSSPLIGAIRLVKILRLSFLLGALCTCCFTFAEHIAQNNQ